MTKKLPTVGVLVGKFLPPHKGHELFIRFAYHFVDELHIIIDNIDDGRYGDDYVPGVLRQSWIAQMFPEAKVTYLDKPMPQDPSIDTENFWKEWIATFNETVGVEYSHVIVAESYGHELARRLGKIYIPFDSSREMVNISATEIRDDLEKNWDHLMESAKPLYTMRVAIVGPESSGKSTLTKDLAQSYNTVYVPEYARMYLEGVGGHEDVDVEKLKLGSEDFVRIAQGQIASEQAHCANAHEIFFCDTDPLLTCVWHAWIMKKEAPDELQNIAHAHTYDLTLVVRPDLPWKKDGVRYHAMRDEREQFFADTITELETQKRNYAIIEGVGSSRLICARKAVDAFYAENFTHAYFVRKLKS